LIACGGQAEPTPTKTPRPTDTATPLPTLERAVALPAVESSASQVQLTETPQASGNTFVSPVDTPTATPIPPTPTPGIEAQAPAPVLAANLNCGAGCNAGNPEGVGLAILDPQSGQFLMWTDKLEALTGQEYEGWLVRDGVVESSGRFNAEPSGVASSAWVLSEAVKSQPWTSFVLTIEPEPDDSDAPAAPHSIGGPLRSTVMGEALYSRFNMPCQECHGAQAEGGSAAALVGTSLPFAEFEAAVRMQHPDADYSEGVIAGRDLQHIYAWLIAPR
jgi:mono/diheme cytochrome c family protein